MQYTTAPVSCQEGDGKEFQPVAKSMAGLLCPPPARPTPLPKHEILNRIFTIHHILTRYIASGQSPKWREKQAAMLLIALCLSAKFGEVWASGAYMASGAGASVKTWYRLLQRLQDMRLVRMWRLKRQNGTAATYLLDLGELWRYIWRILTEKFFNNLPSQKAYTRDGWYGPLPPTWMCRGIPLPGWCKGKWKSPTQVEELLGGRMGYGPLWERLGLGQSA